MSSGSSGETPAGEPGAGRTAALAERLFGAFVAGSELLTVELGRRLGLYEAVHQGGAVTSEQLARTAGITERYAREWLEQQATAGFLDVASDTGEAADRAFELPPSHVPVLLDADHPENAVGFAPVLTGFALTLPAVADAYRTGVGVAFEQFGSEVRHGIGLGNRPMFANGIVDWVDTLPDSAEQLRTGGAVLDVGCGIGYAAAAIAAAFPAVTVDGLDVDAASIAEARTTCPGFADRVRFTVGNASDVTDLPRVAGGYRLGTIFEALHDMADPVAALRAVRYTLAPGGAVLLVDERAADTFAAPGGAIDRGDVRHQRSALPALDHGGIPGDDHGQRNGAARPDGPEVGRSGRIHDDGAADRVALAVISSGMRSWYRPPERDTDPGDRDTGGDHQRQVPQQEQAADGAPNHQVRPLPRGHKGFGTYHQMITTAPAPDPTSSEMTMLLPFVGSGKPAKRSFCLIMT